MGLERRYHDCGSDGRLVATKTSEHFIDDLAYSITSRFREAA